MDDPSPSTTNFDPNPGVPITAEGRGASGVEVQSTTEDRIEVGVQSTAKDRTGAEAGVRNGTKGLQIGGETVTNHLLPEGAGRILVDNMIILIIQLHKLSVESLQKS